jgi:opacity protein-like surface antigen
MKRSILAFYCIVVFAAAVQARAQVAPSATGNQSHLSAGATGSMFQPDYAGTGVAQTSPNRLYGIGAYVDARFTRWAQVEAEGRWSRFNQYCWQDSVCNGEDTYLIGPRIAPYTFRKLTPYGKVLVGFGNGSFLTGRPFAIAFGGGVDYRLTRRFTLRCFDFEYQRWSVTPTLYPYGGSVGLSYQIF